MPALPSWCSVTRRITSGRAAPVSGSRRDHLAPPVAAGDDDLRLVSQPQAPSDPAVLGEAGAAVEPQIDVGAKAAGIERGADLRLELRNRLERDERERPAVGERPIGSQEIETAVVTAGRVQPFEEPRILDRQDVAVRRAHVELVLTGLRVQRRRAAADRLRFGEIRRRRHPIGMPERRVVAQHLGLLPRGEVGKAFARAVPAHGVHAIPVDPGEADEGVLERLAGEALHGIAAQPRDVSDRHGCGCVR